MRSSKSRGLNPPVTYQAGDILVTVQATMLWTSDDVDDVSSSLRLQHGVVALVLQDFNSEVERHNPHVKVLSESQIGWAHIGDVRLLK